MLRCSFLLQEEFNFEEALKRFNKDELVKEAEEEHVRRLLFLVLQ